MLHNHGKYTHKPTLGNCLISQKYGPPLQDSCLENPMDGGVWWAAVQGIATSLTRLSDFTFTFHFHALEEEMATHSSVLAWRISGTGEPGWVAIYGVTQTRTRLKRLSSSSMPPSKLRKEYPTCQKTLNEYFTEVWTKRKDLRMLLLLLLNRISHFRLCATP